MKEKIKNFLIKLAYKFKCHDKCNIEYPCHCNICGEPNNKLHYDKHHKPLVEFNGLSYEQYKKNNETIWKTYEKKN